MIIVNADDFGGSESTNEAIEYAFREGIVNQATLIVNRKSTESAVEWARQNGFLGHVGLHLNLDAGQPLTDPIKKERLFCNNDGVFIRGMKKAAWARFWLPKQTKLAVEIEIRAQIVKFLSYGNVLKHVDSHHHIHNNPSILNIAIPLFREYGFNTMRLAYISEKDKGIRLWLKHYINDVICNSFPLSVPFEAGNFSAYKDQNNMLGGGI